MTKLRKFGTSVATGERQQEQWVAGSGGGGVVEREGKREKKREGNGERGDCRPERGVNDGQLQWRGREKQMVGMGEKTKG